MQFKKPLSLVVTVSAFIFMLPVPAIAADAPAKDPIMGSGKYKTAGPIEITSDSLEVLQQEHKAIFTGHVVAVQGDVRLKSEKMTVFYKSEEEKISVDKKASAASKAVAKENPVTDSAAGKNSIEKIVVENNVFLSTPEETASGTNGIYDVANHKIYLNDNVVLTREKNVLKGERLVYDFETGKSVLNAQDPATASTTATDSGKARSRVKALFIPNEDEKNSDEKLPLKKQ